MAVGPTPPLSEEQRVGLRRIAERRGDAARSFCRELVRTPSPSGDEGAAARRTADEMKHLGFDEVELDAAGNVIGVLRATVPEPGPGAVLLDAHLDHVATGDLRGWPHPPFEGVIADERLWGRGATDTKSAVAAQVHGVACLAEATKELGLPRRRDVIVAAVVQEEVGGLGTAVLLDHAPPLHAAVVGEPSLGHLSLGHRGRVELEVTFEGRAAHASRPEWGVNPHPALARFVTLLEEVERDADPLFGRSTCSPTLVGARPDSPNVIPQSLTLTLDWRNVPRERPETVRERVDGVARRAGGDAVRGHAAIPIRRLVSWTGVERDVERVSRPFATAEESGLARAAHEALTTGLGRSVDFITWDFASDGGWLAAAGVPCIGYGPGEMRLMHAVDESVSLKLVGEAVLGNAILAHALAECEAPGAPS